MDDFVAWQRDSGHWARLLDYGACQLHFTPRKQPRCAMAGGGPHSEADVAGGTPVKRAVRCRAQRGRQGGVKMGTWFWLNFPLALLFFCGWTVIPLWLVLTRWHRETEARHAEIAAQTAAEVVIEIGQWESSASDEAVPAPYKATVGQLGRP